MVNHKEGSGGITVRGKYTIGKDLNHYLYEVFRKEAEQCDSIDGFMLYFSPLGGSGGLLDGITTNINRICQKTTTLGLWNICN